MYFGSPDIGDETTGWYRVLMSPTKGHRDTVELTGYFRYEFENVAFYPTEASNPSFGVWMNLDSVRILDMESLNGRPITIGGIIDTTHHGHLSNFHSEILVTRIME